MRYADNRAMHLMKQLAEGRKEKEGEKKIVLFHELIKKMPGKQQLPSTREYKYPLNRSTNITCYTSTLMCTQYPFQIQSINHTVC